ncbi:MAG: hypothetical protein P4M09_20565 [Devosia sp.]|nr:hypothetical protein [Devosia sp.]
MNASDPSVPSNTNDMRRALRELLASTAAPARADVRVVEVYSDRFVPPYSVDLRDGAMAARGHSWTEQILGLAMAVRMEREAREVPTEAPHRIVRRGRPSAEEREHHAPVRTDRQMLAGWAQELRSGWHAAVRPRVSLALDELIAAAYGSQNLNPGAEIDAQRLADAIDAVLGGLTTRTPEAALLRLARVLIAAFEDLTGTRAGMGIRDSIAPDAQDQGLPHGPFARFVHNVEAIVGVHLLGTDWGLFKRARNMAE